MIEVLFAFLSTGIGKIIVGIFAAIIAAGGAYLRGRSSGKQSERDKQRAKEADAYEQSMQELADANRARNSVDPDSVPEHDPYRRD